MLPGLAHTGGTCFTTGLHHYLRDPSGSTADRPSHPKPCKRGETTRWLLSWLIRTGRWSSLPLQKLQSQGSDSERYQEEGDVRSFQPDNLLSESKPSPPGSIPRHLTCSSPCFLRIIHHLCLPPPVTHPS